jgi:lipoprotein signal peptidase
VGQDNIIINNTEAPPTLIFGHSLLVLLPSHLTKSIVADHRPDEPNLTHYWSMTLDGNHGMTAFGIISSYSGRIFGISGMVSGKKKKKTGREKKDQKVTLNLIFIRT